MRLDQSKIITGSLVTITAFSTAILTLPSALADDGFVDVVTVTVPVSCSLGASGMDTHTASIQNGVTTENIGTTNIKVTCNDSTGYALYAIGYTNDEYGNNKLTSATLGSTYDIRTSTSTSNTSSWAMKLTKTTNDYTPIISGSLDDNNKQTGDPDFSDYSEVPDEYTKVAYALSSTDMGANASGSNLTTTYRAYISQTQPAGTYVGQVKYTLVHPNGNFPFNEETLVGTTLRFNEHVDVESLVEIMGGNYTYNDLHFAMKVTTTDILNYLGVQNPNITTWSQFVDILPALLSSAGATNIQSDMQITNNDQSYAYLNFVGFYPFHQDGSGFQDGQPRNYLYFSRTGYGADTSAWSYLPASTGSISYTLEGETYTFNSFREAIGAINGAWLDENYFEDNWGEEFFRTISIYGGNDATDSDLIQWLKNNSTVLYIDSPVTGEWAFNEYIPSDPGMEWDVSGTIYNK